jgi:dihydroflavonol-4-reductase
MKIFITGSTGFIGKHLIQAFSGSNYNLRCLVRKTSKVDFLGQQKCELFYGDVTDRTSLLQGMDGCDFVINLANVYSMWEPDPAIFYTVNVEGTRNVMIAALESGIKKVIHISSVVIFGKPNEYPFNENSKPSPKRFSEYARTKYEGDKIAWELFERQKLPLVVLYPAAVLGPGDNKATGQYIELLARRKLPALAYPNSVMTWAHVKDVVDAIINAMEKDGNIGEKYIIGKEILSIGEISKMVEEISGVPLPKFVMPNWMTWLSASLLTKIADLIKSPPMWGMALDQIKTMKEGFRADGRKSEKDLEIHYRSVYKAIKEMLLK